MWSRMEPHVARLRLSHIRETFYRCAAAPISLIVGIQVRCVRSTAKVRVRYRNHLRGEDKYSNSRYLLEFSRIFREMFPSLRPLFSHYSVSRATLLIGQNTRINFTSSRHSLRVEVHR